MGLFKRKSKKKAGEAASAPAAPLAAGTISPKGTKKQGMFAKKRSKKTTNAAVAGSETTKRQPKIADTAMTVSRKKKQMNAPVSSTKSKKDDEGARMKQYSSVSKKKPSKSNHQKIPLKEKVATSSKSKGRMHNASIVAESPKGQTGGGPLVSPISHNTDKTDKIDNRGKSRSKLSSSRRLMSKVPEEEEVVSQGEYGRRSDQSGKGWSLLESCSMCVGCAPTSDEASSGLEQKSARPDALSTMNTNVDVVVEDDEPTPSEIPQNFMAMWNGWNDAVDENNTIDNQPNSILADESSVNLASESEQEINHLIGQTSLESSDDDRTHDDYTSLGDDRDYNTVDGDTDGEDEETLGDQTYESSVFASAASSYSNAKSISSADSSNYTYESTTDGSEGLSQRTGSVSADDTFSMAEGPDDSVTKGSEESSMIDSNTVASSHMSSTATSSTNQSKLAVGAKWLSRMSLLRRGARGSSASPTPPIAAPDVADAVDDGKPKVRGRSTRPHNNSPTPESKGPARESRSRTRSRSMSKIKKRSLTPAQKTRKAHLTANKPKPHRRASTRSPPLDKKSKMKSMTRPSSAPPAAPIMAAKPAPAPQKTHTRRNSKIDTTKATKLASSCSANTTPNRASLSISRGSGDSKYKTPESSGSGESGNDASPTPTRFASASEPLTKKVPNTSKPQSRKSEETPVPPEPQLKESAAAESGTTSPEDIVEVSDIDSGSLSYKEEVAPQPVSSSPSDMEEVAPQPMSSSHSNKEEEEVPQSDSNPSPTDVSPSDNARESQSLYASPRTRSPLTTSIRSVSKSMKSGTSKVMGKSFRSAPVNGSEARRLSPAIFDKFLAKASSASPVPEEKKQAVATVDKEKKEPLKCAVTNSIGSVEVSLSQEKEKDEHREDKEDPEIVARFPDVLEESREDCTLSTEGDSVVTDTLMSDAELLLNAGLAPPVPE